MNAYLISSSLLESSDADIRSVPGAEICASISTPRNLFAYSSPANLTLTTLLPTLQFCISLRPAVCIPDPDCMPLSGPSALRTYAGTESYSCSSKMTGLDGSRRCNGLQGISLNPRISDK